MANAVVGLFLGELGFGQNVVIYATSAPPEGMQWLSLRDAALLGIDVTALSRSAIERASPAAPSIVQTKRIVAPQESTPVPTPRGSSPPLNPGSRRVVNPASIDEFLRSLQGGPKEPAQPVTNPAKLDGRFEEKARKAIEQAERERDARLKAQKGTAP
ncbi:hypothetical protein MesoLjLb_18790 [Mesorhizobium sp. L-8-3]|nr:hypothetical protein MesoLjLb_18790 [Mesorhizobium sp. L-8-3]